MTTGNSSDSKESESARTPLYQSHLDAGGKLVDFAGWQMPVSYGSQIEEHHAVRRAAGMFDVSHMTIVDIAGSEAQAFLSRLLANNIARASAPGKALYTCMLNENGGIIDDLIAYSRTRGNYRLVVNAATRDKDLAWIEQHKPSAVSISERSELAMIAVQGPQAEAALKQCLDSDLAEQVAALARFSAIESGEWFIARTGYTGEDGYEISLPGDAAAGLWSRLLEAQLRPCGLGARDTLRLEAGMNVYGSDMDESVTPLQSGLNWTIGWQPAERDFIGRSALEAQKEQGVHRSIRGLVLQGRGVLRGGQQVYIGEQLVGEVTSGTFSPTLQQSIAFARIEQSLRGSCMVEIRGKLVAATIVALPFVKNGEAAIKPV